MPLSYPMHAEPGELLVTTELAEDADYNRAWVVPDWHDGTPLKYGDLLLVIACQREDDDEHGTTRWPTWMFHHRTQRIIYVDDIEDVGWLWRPENRTSWHRESA